VLTAQVWISSPTTRGAQLSRLRNLSDALVRWRESIPFYLDWDKHNSALSKHSYLKLQRSFLEIQFQCLQMRLQLSVAHLNPSMLSKNFSWNAGIAYSESLRAGQRIVDIITSSGLPSNAYRMYHWEAIRASSTLLQILLRHDFTPAQLNYDTLAETCREGISVSRRLAPRTLTNVENIIENALEK
jgi:hypothetical protein